MAKFRVSIMVEVDAPSEASALAGVVGRQRVLPIANTRVTYIPQRGDIVTVSNIKYGSGYRVIRVEGTRVAHLQEVGGVGRRSRVWAWQCNLQPVASAEQVARDIRVAAFDQLACPAQSGR